MRHLASWGFVVIATQSGLELFPDHQRYADDMRLCLDWLAERNSEPGGEFYASIDTNHFGISGHSMGGGAGVLAAADEPRIAAVATLAAAETRPSAIESAGRVRAPSLYVVGTQDKIAPPGIHTRPMFEHAIAPRIFAAIRGASHCGFLGVPLPDVVCDEGSLPRRAQLAETHELLTAFFRLHLYGDTNAWPFVWGPAASLNPLTEIESDPGFLFDPGFCNRRVKSGESGLFTLTLANTEVRPTRFRFDATGNTNGLSITPEITQVLTPGTSTNIFIRLRLPPGRPQAFTIVTARPDSDPRISASTILRVTGGR